MRHARLIDRWDGADLAVVVDAVRAAPGRVHEVAALDDTPVERAVDEVTGRIARLVTEQG